MKKAVVAIVGRGGVGKSMIAKELACIYASKAGFSKEDNTRVLLIDTNFSFSTQAFTNKISTLQYDFADLVNDHRKLNLTREEYKKKYDWSYLQKYMWLDEGKNLYFLTVSPKSKGAQEMKPQELSKPEANTIYEALGELFDVIIIDCNNGWGGEVLAAMMLSTTIVFVNEDNLSSHQKIMQLRRELVARGLGGKLASSAVLICNKVDPAHTFMSPVLTSAYLDLPLAATLPNIPELFLSSTDKPPVSRAFRQIGEPLYKLAGDIVREEIPYDR